MKKRLLAMLMALVLVLSCLPTWSVAAEGEHIHCQCGKETPVVQLPDGILQCFDDELVLCGETRRLFVTLGQFSIIRLERDAQLIVPVLDYSIPTKECCDSPGCAEDPCEMFSRIPFPAAQFAPRDCDRQRDCEPCDNYTTPGNC